MLINKSGKLAKIFGVGINGILKAAQCNFKIVAHVDNSDFGITQKSIPLLRINQDASVIDRINALASQCYNFLLDFDLQTFERANWREGLLIFHAQKAFILRQV